MSNRLQVYRLQVYSKTQHEYATVCVRDWSVISGLTAASRCDQDKKQSPFDSVSICEADISSSDYKMDTESKRDCFLSW